MIRRQAVSASKPEIPRYDLIPDVNASTSILIVAEDRL